MRVNVTTCLSLTNLFMFSKSSQTKYILYDSIYVEFKTVKLINGVWSQDVSYT